MSNIFEKIDSDLKRQLSPERLALLEAMTLGDVIGILFDHADKTTISPPSPPERRSCYSFDLIMAFAARQDSIQNKEAWSFAAFQSGRFDLDIERWVTDGVAGLGTQTGVSMIDEPVKDNRPPIERSMERLRIAVVECESAGHKLRERLGPVMRPENAGETNAVGAERPPMSDHTFQIEAVIRNIGWITGNLEDILVRLETPLPPPDSPRPIETSSKV